MSGMTECLCRRWRGSDVTLTSSCCRRWEMSKDSRSHVSHIRTLHRDTWRAGKQVNMYLYSDLFQLSDKQLTCRWQVPSRTQPVYGHFGSKTFRQQDTSAAEECSRSVSWCRPYVYLPSFGIGGFGWFNFKSILRFCIVFIAFLVLISVPVYHNKSVTCETHIACYISYSCSRHTMF